MSDDTKSGDVHAFRLVEVDGYVQQEVVKELEEILELAKEGKVTNLLYAYQKAGEGYTTGACGDWVSGHEMTGVSYALLQRVSSLVNDEDDYYEE